jgi:hypothetical protein
VVRKNRHKTEIVLRHEKAANIRLKAIETQLSLGFTLCATAETDMLAGNLESARKLLRKLQHHAKTISFHIDEPGHVPETAVRRLRNQMTELETRKEKVDALLRSS